MDHFEDIIGYEECYQINRLGQVKNIASGRILKPANSSGYLCVNLCKNGVRKKYYIHRLLGIQFILNPENKLEIDHIDRNKNNNSLENLRWATRKEQQNNLSNNVTDYRLNNLKRTRNCNRWRDIKSVFLRILL
jgi:hypothetical protein